MQPPDVKTKKNEFQIIAFCQKRGVSCSYPIYDYPAYKMFRVGDRTPCSKVLQECKVSHLIDTTLYVCSQFCECKILGILCSECGYVDPIVWDRDLC